ncbi:MAG: helix-turn-helix domain-containing protein [Bacillota bacterium]
MKKQIPRHNSIGEKIREARKKRGITLGELAKGICSLGKMSNIENGHIPITNEELMKFCEKLNIPTNFFSDPEIDEKIRKLDFFKQKISDLIGLKHWSYVKSELSNFKEKIDAYQIPSREIDYYFLSGIFYLKTNQYERSEEFLTKVIDEEENNNYNMRLKLKAYNALSSFFFNQKKISKSIHLLDRALEISKESPTITKEERDNIYFNRSILYLYIGAIYHSLKNINKINHHLIYPLETEYIKLLIKFLEDESIDEIRENLLVLREKLQQTNDKEGILRGWALTIYTIMTSYPKSNLIERWKDSFLFDLNLIGEMDEFKEKSLALFQLGIFVCLSYTENQTIVEELIRKTKPLLLEVEDQLLVARNYYLEAKFHKQYLEDQVTSLSLFQRALETLNTNDEGLLKADILFEISKLMKIENEAMDALELYHGHLKSQFLFTHFHELVLPTFKY